jgi:hypothetical protein
MVTHYVAPVAAFGVEGRREGRGTMTPARCDAGERAPTLGRGERRYAGSGTGTGTGTFTGVMGVALNLAK